MSEPLLRLSDLHFAYPGQERPVLDGASLELHASERVAICGPTGSGKTTLLHAIAGLVAPQSGEIWALGRARSREADFIQVRQQFGLMFQEPDDQLFCPTVEEDVAFGPMNLGRAAAQALAEARGWIARLGLAGYEKRLPHTLSGGEKRLAALAGVLAMEPKVLLLDEPTSGLDDTARETIENIIGSGRYAAIMISHDASFIRRMCSRRLNMANGRLAEDGRHSS